MQTRSSDENSVHLSVCQTLHGEKTEERSVQIFIPYERSFSLVFWEWAWEWSVDATPSTWNFGSTGPRRSEISDFQQIFACSASAVTPSEKSSVTLIGSPLRAFQWAQDDHRTLPLSPQKGGSKTQNGQFPSKIALRLKKVCYKVSLYENGQRQSCKAFIGLTIRAKMIGGRRRLVPEILDQTDCVGAKSPILISFRS